MGFAPAVYLSAPMIPLRASESVSDSDARINAATAAWLPFVLPPIIIAGGEEDFGV